MPSDATRPAPLSSSDASPAAPTANGATSRHPVRAQPQLVCFDLGGVLVRLVANWAEACHIASVPMRGFLAHPRTEEWAVLHAKGQMSDTQWAEAHAHAGAPYTAKELLQIQHDWIRGEYEGVDVVVARLRELGVATACLSNTSEGHWRRMVHRDGVAPLAGPPEFPTVASLNYQLASHRLGAAKPDATIYEAFESTTGCRGPRILFFDDLAVNVEAARARGWNSERLDPTQATAPQLRTWLAKYGLE